MDPSIHIYIVTYIEIGEAQGFNRDAWRVDVLHNYGRVPGLGCPGTGLDLVTRGQRRGRLPEALVVTVGPRGAV